jgi:two-component system, cell cycle sensor histidine kinase and response regulator CckA
MNPQNDSAAFYPGPDVFRPRPSRERAARQRQALIDLTRPGTAGSGDLRSSLREITRLGAETLDVERLSVWFFNESRTALSLRTLFLRTSARHTQGVELKVADYPAYFKAIAESEVVAAHEAGTDARTREFTIGYLAPLGITSMMDAPIFVEGVIHGVVCHEHVGLPRTWTDDEQTFAVALASLVALAIGQERRREAEEALRFQKSLLEAQTEAAQDGIMVLSRDGRILSHNRRLVELWRIPADLLGADSERNMLNFILDNLAHPKEFIARVSDLQSRPDDVSSEEVLLSDGRVFEHYTAPVRASGRAFYGRVWFFRDVTARKRLEAQVRQGQKMEAIGRLAGGVAHDFNNLLTAILGYSDVLSAKLAGHESLLADLAEIRQSGERAASLTSQLLAFSRQQTVQPKILDLNRVVGKVEKMLRRLIGEDVDLRTDLAATLWSVRADAVQIDQVLMNLAVNARDAMPRGGRLTIETRDVALDSAFVREHPGSAAGPHVLIRVTDTGSGMPKEVLAHCFEPFFTTKELGKGTGLGLATVYGIIKQNHGYVGVSSEPGKGTSFEIYLPKVNEKPSGACETVMLPCILGTERLLLVEDEVVVRKLVSQTLKAQGYTVTEAVNGDEALKIAMRQSSAFDLVITDMVMPGMGGRDLGRKLREMWPDMPVLYMSGYTEDAAIRQGGLEEGAILVRKPFSPNDMMVKVRKALQHATRGKLVPQS